MKPLQIGHGKEFKSFETLYTPWWKTITHPADPKEDSLVVEGVRDGGSTICPGFEEALVLSLPGHLIIHIRGILILWNLFTYVLQELGNPCNPGITSARMQQFFQALQKKKLSSRNCWFFSPFVKLNKGYQPHFIDLKCRGLTRYLVLWAPVSFFSMPNFKEVVVRL